MTQKRYLECVSQKKIEEKKVLDIQKVYGAELPDLIKKIISNSDEPVFFDDGVRILSFKEILNAEKDLHVDFQSKGIIPIADCGENDFIVYHFKEAFWSKFNIIDEISFKKVKGVGELLK